MTKSESRSSDSFLFSEQAIVNCSSLSVDAECCYQIGSDNGETAIHPRQPFFADDSSDNPNDNISHIRYSENPTKIHLDTELGKRKSFNLDRVTPSSVIFETIQLEARECREIINHETSTGTWNIDRANTLQAAPSGTYLDQIFPTEGVSLQQIHEHTEDSVHPLEKPRKRYVVSFPSRFHATMQVARFTGFTLGDFVYERRPVV